MRPLIEILEDERTLMHKSESVHRYLSKTADEETLDILLAQREKIERDIVVIHIELRAYLSALLKNT